MSLRLSELLLISSPSSISGCSLSVASLQGNRLIGTSGRKFAFFSRVSCKDNSTDSPGPASYDTSTNLFHQTNSTFRSSSGQRFGQASRFGFVSPENGKDDKSRPHHQPGFSHSTSSISSSPAAAAASSQVR